ncbi:hypothetical protein JHN63_05830 [Streptomyces sp. MBT65]|uniref:hypothetical protein n=1 Tax=Streptomyces sp. MBT65 TaxID=1488395 RepID=UPI00190CB7EE|nr:hypothetical protein [Streptomyces sp. MBT65]MBK3573348.1 hypothetical protein [Streptomyces sp. MBT65]
MTDRSTPVDGFPQRVLRRSRAHRRADAIACGLLVGLDIFLVALILLLGSDGVFTEDWMGYAGMMDSTAASYQYHCVVFLCRAEAVTVALAIACRLWTTAAAQLVVLTSAAVFVASLATYWNP